MNEKPCLDEAVFVFVVQSSFWKILIFLTQTCGSGKPRCASLASL